MSTFIVYRTDSWHSYKSRDIIGIGTTLQNAIKIVIAGAKKEGYKLNKEQLYNIQTLNQTQGHEGVGEFQIEEVESNKLF